MAATRAAMTNGGLAERWHPRYDPAHKIIRGRTIMNRRIALATVSLIALVAAAPASSDSSSLEQRFDASVRPQEMSDWMKIMASEPNHVGSPHDKINAEWEMKKFQEFGWDAHLEEFEVLYPTPVAESLTLLGKKPFNATLQEKPIPGDTSATAKDKALPAYLE